MREDQFQHRLPVRPRLDHVFLEIRRRVAPREHPSGPPVARHVDGPVRGPVGDAADLRRGDQFRKDLETRHREADPRAGLPRRRRSLVHCDGDIGQARERQSGGSAYQPGANNTVQGAV